MMKLIKDVIVSMRSIIYFDAINIVIKQSIKNNRKDAIDRASKVKYNKKLKYEYRSA